MNFDKNLLASDEKVETHIKNIKRYCKMSMLYTVSAGVLYGFGFQKQFTDDEYISKMQTQTPGLYRAYIVDLCFHLFSFIFSCYWIYQASSKIESQGVEHASEAF